MQRIAVLTQEVDKLTKNLKLTKERVSTLSTDLFKARRIGTNDAYRADIMQSTVTKLNALAKCNPAEPMDGINVEKGEDKVEIECRLSKLSEKLSGYIESVDRYKTAMTSHIDSSKFVSEGIISDGLNIFPDPKRWKGGSGRKSVLNPKKMMMRRLKNPEKFHMRRPHTSESSRRPKRIPPEANEMFSPPSNFLMERKNEMGASQFLLAPLHKSREDASYSPGIDSAPLQSPHAVKRGINFSPHRTPKMYSWME